MASDKFGTAAVRNAWYDPKHVFEHVISVRDFACFIIIHR